MISSLALLKAADIEAFQVGLMISSLTQARAGRLPGEYGLAGDPLPAAFFSRSVCAAAPDAFHDSVAPRPQQRRARMPLTHSSALIDSVQRDHGALGSVVCRPVSVLA